MILGYNTNGFAHHDIGDAIDIIAELGYGGVAFTLDVNHFEYAKPHAFARTADIADRIHERNLACVMETGARFILDPRRKHQPTLISPEPHDRHRRFEFLQLCVDLAPTFGATVVSYWSGTATDNASSVECMNRLVEQCRKLAEYSATKNVRLAFEPEPGMFIDTMEKFAELHSRVNHPNFGLTVDVGHLVCNGEIPASEHLLRWKDWLWNVHIEDMRRGVHDHLMFGEGEVDFADVFAGLRAADFRGMISVELSRHSFDAVNAAKKSIEFLRRFL